MYIPYTEVDDDETSEAEAEAEQVDDAYDAASVPRCLPVHHSNSSFLHTNVDVGERTHPVEVAVSVSVLTQVHTVLALNYAVNDAKHVDVDGVHHVH